MRTSDRGIELLHHFEGCKLTAYFDMVGVPTIGYGHTRSVSSADVRNRRTITQEEAEELFRTDLAIYEKAVRDAGVKYGIEWTQWEFDALVSFAYNLGTGSLKTMLRGARSRVSDPKDMDVIVAHRMLLYRNAGGRPVAGIIRRRLSEAHLFEHGENLYYKNSMREIRKLASMSAKTYLREAREMLYV